jgi:L,D-peptidoglycan transpeptidase YkuD (ErfK/YbiS/YcfS/YnhG family)
MKYFSLATTLLLLASVAPPSVYGDEMPRTDEPRVPKIFEAAIPAKCLQVVLVLSPQERSVPARLWLLARATAEEQWKTDAGPIAVTLGRNGLAWGDGEHSGVPPPGIRTKREGDGCSPAGVFRMPFAFGYAPESEATMVQIPYRAVTSTVFAVDDSQSRFYNQVVDTKTVTKDWRTAEIMLRDDILYRWGVYVAHNPHNRSFRGSCISLHIWRGPGAPTAGCTAMSEEEMIRVMKWLNPAKEPLLVQGVEGW